MAGAGVLKQNAPTAGVSSRNSLFANHAKEAARMDWRHLAATCWPVVIAALAVGRPGPGLAKAPAKTGVEVVRSVVGEGSSAIDEPPAACERRAREDAIRKAQESAGVEVHSVLFDLQSYAQGKDHDVLADYAMHLSRNLATVEDYDRARDFKVESGAAGLRCRLQVKVRLLSLGRPDPAFVIRGLALDQPAYFEGQEARLGFRVTRDSYVYVLNVDAGGNVTLVLPNKLSGGALRAKAGETISFPTEASGLRLVAALPPGSSSSVEVLHVIAARDARDLFAESDASAQAIGPYTQLSLGSLGKVARRLASMDRARWTMAVAPFHIRKKP